jgi:altronate hydrolase
LLLHPDDNVAVALVDLTAGSRITLWDGRTLPVMDDVPFGHKVAVSAIAPGAAVIKYGYPMGRATAPIRPGQWVHTHNVRTAKGGTGGDDEAGGTPA